MINETKGLISNSETIPLQWNNFLITFDRFKISFEYEVLVSSNKLGIIELTNSRTRRLELILLLQEKYQMNSVEISDFLIRIIFKPLTTKLLTIFMSQTLFKKAY